MDKIEKATDVGKIHYPFVSQTDGFGVTIEKKGHGKTTGFKRLSYTHDTQNKARELYEKRYIRFADMKSKGQSYTEISTKLGISENTLRGKKYTLRYVTEQQVKNIR